MNTARFCNCVPEEVSIDLNSADEAIVLGSRATEDGAVTLAMHGFLVAEEPAMATFGTGGHNIVTVEFTGLHDAPHSFGITVDPDVQGQDLYFYVFANTLVGQDQHGRSKGVTITRIETIRREIQSGADVPAVRLPIPLNMLSNLNLIPSPSKKSGQ